MDKKIIVISGVNLIDGGPISVYLDFLNAIVENGYSEKYRVIALVGKKELFQQFSNKIELTEFRDSKKSWLNRLYLEYIGFKKLSKEMVVDTWISMHDTTPNVIAKHRFVYCQNASPFNDMSIKDVKFGLKYYLFSKFYKYLYKINIHKNDAVIVQQDWMRKEFKKIYGTYHVIVARPSMPEINTITDNSSKEKDCIFVCPSFPRYYKNFQVACEAAIILKNKHVNNFKLFITLSGEENKYSKFLKQKYGHCSCIVFGGLLSRDDLFKLYGRSKCLIFMSRLESWGMPISEYKSTRKPMILSDLPYAHETVGGYNQVEFVNTGDSLKLSQKMQSVIEGHKFNSSRATDIDEPYANNWYELCCILFENWSCNEYKK